MTTALNHASLQEALERFRIPGAAAAVYHRGKTRLYYAGQARIAEQVPVDGSTLFQVGSVTKVFTATLIQKLAAEGALHLDDPVSRHLPDLRIGGATPADSVSIRSLLDYSSGIEGQYFADFGDGEDALARYVQACTTLRMIHPPGRMRGYNSTSYCIAGRLIEVITGRAFDTALQEYLLAPLGVEHWSFYNPAALEPEAATGHYWNERSGRFEQDSRLRLPRAMSPAGASLSLTATGLLEFGLMHLNEGLNRNGARFLETELIQEMYLPHRVVPPNDAELLLGWAALPTDAGRVVVASGRTIGHNAFVLFQPGADFALSIMSNNAAGAELLFRTLGLAELKACTGATPILPDAPTPPESGAVENVPDPERYLGTYRNPAELTVSAAGDGLTIQSRSINNATGHEETDAATLVAAGEHRFLVAAESGEITGQAQFLFEDAQRERASHLYTNGCVFGRV